MSLQIWGLPSEIAGIAIGSALTWIPLVAIEAKRFFLRRRMLKESRRAAARALRDDFYGMQEQLALGYVNRRWLKHQRHEWRYVGDNEHLLAIANAIEGQNGWSAIASARRRLITAAHLRQTGIYPGREWIVEAFNELERGRHATRTVDRGWQPGNHPAGRKIPGYVPPADYMADWWRRFVRTK